MSCISKVKIKSDDFNLIGGEDTPPKEGNQVNLEEVKQDKAFIPITENDISGLEYITEG